MPLKMVSVERSINDKIPTIQSDNYHGGYLATEELIRSGCKNILCVSGDPKLQTPANDRSKASLECAKEHGVTHTEINIPFTCNIQQKYQIIEDMLTQETRYDGVFAGDDMMAAIVLNFAREHEIDVPTQLKVIGFDGTEIFTKQQFRSFQLFNNLLKN